MPEIRLSAERNDDNRPCPGDVETGGEREKEPKLRETSVILFEKGGRDRKRRSVVTKREKYEFESAYLYRRFYHCRLFSCPRTGRVSSGQPSGREGHDPPAKSLNLRTISDAGGLYAVSSI